LDGEAALYPCCLVNMIIFWPSRGYQVM
jgi:hypothetical protein